MLTTIFSPADATLADQAHVEAAEHQLTELALALALVAAKVDVERRALADSLTGLPNRAAFERAINRELGSADRRLKPIGVILLDLDRLKAVNDTLGHQAGDEFLRAVAQSSTATLRKGDMIARFGGDEFAVLLLDCDEQALAAGGERIRAAIAGIELGEGLTASTSLGGVLVSDASSTWHLVYGAADSALYTAKRAGGNQIVIAKL